MEELKLPPLSLPQTLPLSKATPRVQTGHRLRLAKGKDSLKIRVHGVTITRCTDIAQHNVDTQTDLPAGEVEPKAAPLQVPAINNQQLLHHRPNHTVAVPQTTTTASKEGIKEVGVVAEAADTTTEEEEARIIKTIDPTIITIKIVGVITLRR